ncbi:MAG: LysM peptidoglycan-binding domain-containing protein, partial [Anaerolineae bacterium]
SVATLAAANQIANPSRIFVGQMLAIPTGNAVIAPPPAVPDPNPAPGGNGTYTVRPGDTLSIIARKFGVDMAALAAVNHLANPSFIRVGQILTMPGAAAAPPPANPEPAPTETPPDNGTVYIVKRGDTLYIIARKFGVTVQALTAVNQITNPSLIFPGQKLLIAAGGNDSNPVPAEPAPQSTFIWPVDGGWIVKRYAVGHQAIDIAVPTGTAVKAMAAGKVEYAGWNNFGYGNLVVVDHGNGWRTLYAHNSAFQVKTGDVVAQGDVIALSGSTGNSSMPHVHLEMMLNFGGVNPCLHLPGGC